MPDDHTYRVFVFIFSASTASICSTIAVATADDAHCIRLCMTGVPKQKGMNFFLHQIRIQLIKISNVADIRRFDEVWQEAPLVLPRNRQALWLNPSAKEVRNLLMQAIHSSKDHPPLRITLAVKDKPMIRSALKKAFPIVKAAGGLVRKGEALLFIYRRQHWDFPKGKIDKNESSEKAAVREVEEECQVKALCRDKIATTYHPMMSYGRDKTGFKRTTWYSMDLLDDANMQPQLEESIEKVAWIPKKDFEHYLPQAYPSIRYLVERYERLQTGYSTSA